MWLSSASQSDSKMPPVLWGKTILALRLGFLPFLSIFEVAFVLTLRGGLEGEGRRGSQVCRCPLLCRELVWATFADMLVLLT